MTQAVVRQLDAYNRRGHDTFLACHAEDAQRRAPPDRLTDAEPLAMRGRYHRRFDVAPALHATRVARRMPDRLVVDQERVHGKPGGPFEALVTYEVVGRIANAWFAIP